MNAQLPPSGFDYLWIIGVSLALLPVASTILLALLLQEAKKIRRILEKKE